MAEQFMIKGVDVMTLEGRAALDMLVQERGVIEYWYSKDADLQKNGLERFVKLVQLMTIKADPDDDEEMTDVFESIAKLVNFFDSDYSYSTPEKRAASLGILDFIAEQGIDFTKARYCGSQRTSLRDYLLKMVHKKIPLLEKMFQVGVDLDKTLDDGKTLAHSLVARDRFGSPYETDPREQELVECMEFFSTESMEALDGNGICAVHAAAKNNHFEVLEAMIRKGVNVNVTADSPAVAGSTPLHMACEHGYPKIVQMLMDAGADDTIMNVKEETPAHIAVSKKISYKEIKDEERVQMLRALKHIDIPGREGKTPLMFVQSRDLYISGTISPLLIEMGADVNRRDNDGNNAMMLCAEWHGTMNVVKAMVKAGLDLNARNKEGNTVLHRLLVRNNVQAAVYLIKKGADYNIANEKQVTPMQIAVEEGHTEVLELMDI